MMSLNINLEDHKILKLKARAKFYYHFLGPPLASSPIPSFPHLIHSGCHLKLKEES